MATIKFRLKSTDNKPVSIYIRLSLGRGKEFETTTGFNVKPTDWSIKTCLPKSNSLENRQLTIDLKKLESFVLDLLNKDAGTSALIDNNWLKQAIVDCFNRVEKTDEGLLVNHIQYIIDNASTRNVRGGKLGLSPRRIMGYTTFKNLITEYQKKIGRQINFLEIDRRFVDEFTDWLIKQKSYTINYSGKNLDNLRTVCKDAQDIGIKTNPFIDKIKGFSENDDERHIVTLSLDELHKIENLKLTSQGLDNARKWLLIGCALGQRGGDLLSLSGDNIRYSDGQMLVDIIQEKTKKAVTIPILSKYVIDLIENKMPHQISEQKLNKYIKEVCKLAEIDEVVEGKKLNPETRRKALGKYPKHELVVSHSFRRSFATNYYKRVPTAVLMTITGHARESNFLQYINRKEDKDANAKLFAKYVNEMNVENVQPKLNVIKAS